MTTDDRRSDDRNVTAGAPAPVSGGRAAEAASPCEPGPADTMAAAVNRALIDRQLVAELAELGAFAGGVLLGIALRYGLRRAALDLSHRFGGHQ